MVCDDLDRVNGTFEFSAPVLEGLYNSQHLLVVDWVVGLGRGHSLGEITNWVPFSVKTLLGEHSRDNSV